MSLFGDLNIDHHHGNNDTHKQCFGVKRAHWHGIMASLLQANWTVYTHRVPYMLTIAPTQSAAAAETSKHLISNKTHTNRHTNDIIIHGKEVFH